MKQHLTERPIKAMVPEIDRDVLTSGICNHSPRAYASERPLISLLTFDNERGEWKNAEIPVVQ